MKSCATLHLSEHAADLGVLAIAFASLAGEPAGGSDRDNTVGAAGKAEDGTPQAALGDAGGAEHQRAEGAARFGGEIGKERILLDWFEVVEHEPPEHRRAGQTLFEAVGKPAGGTLAVAPSVTDENPGHSVRSPSARRYCSRGASW